MTIDEAMINLSIILQFYINFQDHYSADALKLGIEALKRIKEARQCEEEVSSYPLSGETE